MNLVRPLLFAAALWLGAPSLLPAQNWPNWRGPSFDGSTTATNLPVEFSPTNNVKWVANLPGPGAATPIVWNNHVFVSSTDLTTKTLRAMAFERSSGRLLWNHEVAPGYSRDERSTFASPSPVTDGERVFFYYSSGDLAAYDFAGQKLWARNLQKEFGTFAFYWTYSSSPIWFEGRLFVQVLQRDVPVNGRGRTDGPIESYLLAVDPKTGRDLWKHVRLSDALMESREAFTTPLPSTHAGRTELIVAGGDYLTGHDLKTGAELWRWGTWNPTRTSQSRVVPSPVAGHGVALVAAPRGEPVYAIKLGGAGKLDETGLARNPIAREVSSDATTPASYAGRFYVLNSDKKILSRVNPATGVADWMGDLGTRIKFEASPTIADDKIYVQNFKGEVYVVAAGPEFKILHVAAMGDANDKDLRSSIAIAHSQLFIRTGSKLYCVGAGR